MQIEFDREKNESNLATHGLSLTDFDGFDFEPVILEDDRFDYGEVRYRAFGLVGGKGRCLVFTMRGETMRLISFRRAHNKEMRRHAP